MELSFQIDQQLDIPIYRQIADTVRGAVKNGVLASGEQLPTVAELSAELSIAKGTIKRAYDELEKLGVIEKIQGRGTFICQKADVSGSRKEQAMEAIDQLLSQLEGMGFSSTEIGIFLALKQRQRFEQLSTVKVAAVADAPEVLSRLCEQIRTLECVDLYSYLLDSLCRYPYQLDEETDLVITTAEAKQLPEQVLPETKKLARVAMRLTVDTLRRLVRLPQNGQIAVLSYSSEFASMVRQDCKAMGMAVEDWQEGLLGGDVAAFLRGKNALLMPGNFEKYCTAGDAHLLQRFAKKGKIIRCDYQLDKGSYLYLEEKLRLLRQSK